MSGPAALAAITLALAFAFGCSAEEGPPRCGSYEYGWSAMVPGPTETGHDARLAALARKYDRQFHAITGKATGLNADLAVPLAATELRAKISAFLEAEDGFQFDGFPAELSGPLAPSWQKSAGLYSGAAAAADAFRYGVFRDQGYPCEEIAIAREHLLADLETLHVATAITGVPGVIARSLARTDYPGDGRTIETVPLFDAEGRALPLEKNNGTWRRDATGNYPSWQWEDSISRDMLIGWAMAHAAVEEVTAGDPSIPADRIATLRADAAAIVRGLRTVRAAGYDLEIPDADGRTTYHGYLNENAFERAYIPGIDNGFYALMALGIVAGFNTMAKDPDLDRYLADELIGARDLPAIAADDLVEVDLGVASNFSNYNMAFTGVWLALRYIRDDVALGKLRVSLEKELYNAPGRERQPAEMGQSFFDFVYAAEKAGSHPGVATTRTVDAGAVARGLATLAEFPEPPSWEVGRTNCDEQEVMSGMCTLTDGTVVELLRDSGRGGNLVSRQPIPMRARPPSNYHWRSNPYSVNGESDGSRLLPGGDFRAAYWLGRWVRTADPR